MNPIKRVGFWQVFKINPDGSLEPLRRVRIGGVEFGLGVRFTRGVSFSGIDLFQFIGNDLEIEVQGEIVIIKGVYPNG